MREKLQAARKAKGLTQQAVADALGITLRHYQKIEYAEIGGSFEIWDALEDLLWYINVHSESFQIIVPTKKKVGRHIEKGSHINQ